MSHSRDFEARLTRRELLAATAALALPLLPTEAARAAAEKAYAMPGPYRGKVVEVFHPGSVVGGKVQQEAVRAMMTRGMRELTGDKDEIAGWKRFVSPGDVVLVKVCPVGKPLSITQPQTVLEVIRCLNAAGVPNKDIIVYDRYRDEFLACGYDKILPAGVRWAYAEIKVDGVQVSTEGYDPDVYVTMERVHPEADEKNPVHHRSHLARVISKETNKIINVGVLKDHASAGLTLALKNMSHGMHNNVSRSHASESINWCNTFIPTAAGNPAVRERAVLHIGDGLIGTYDGGPGNWNPHFRTWEYRSLFFATDPVAMDRVGWEIIDAKRTKEGLPLLAETGKLGKNPGDHEGFNHRQPEHVLLAGKAGLGEADLAKITHRKVRLG